MNGIVANPTTPPARRPAGGVPRAILVLGCCILSCGLIGAMHWPAWTAARTGARTAKALPPDQHVTSSTAVPSAAEPKPALANVRMPVRVELTTPTSATAAPARSRELLREAAAAAPMLASARLRANPLNDNVATTARSVSVAATIASKVDKVFVPPSIPARPASRFRTMWMEVTAYCPCKKCCGPRAQGITASGKRVSYNGGKFVAADKFLPFNTRLVIPGYNNGAAVPVLDRGGAIKGNKLDVYFPTHSEARVWGRRWVQVMVLN